MAGKGVRGRDPELEAYWRGVLQEREASGMR